ncbi:putative conserved small protein [Gloeomargarita lithophora Alchichica-D10]|uniref:Putative conserved small protein n=1 Tax=Gloeomargarita lithophora Alchichica-D10 TaxID=1188229 RepID=A0A1J0ACC7_9CYAN|nr:DUF2281 domain-containing protein [Gloeomargarita lithophora]APB33569.1 putative conserved small protein [Gloeomargarita lithophora Alchichica-D10]
MTTDTEILQTITQMPESLKQEVLHYAKYLIENYTESKNGEKEPRKKRRAGSLKGKIWMADDFDAPLEDLKDYM